MVVPQRRMRRAAGLLAVALAGLAACQPAVRNPDFAQPVLRLRWRVVTSDRAREVGPQEFASVAAAGDHVYTGSAGGRFFALYAENGHVRWQRKLGSVSSRPTIAGNRLFLGTDDGELLAVDQLTGDVIWRYETRGPILESPVVVDDLVIFSNEADQVYALDARQGTFRWQYKGETPAEYTLRGHAAVTIVGDLAITGFANGTLVALRVSTGSVAWLTSIKGDGDRFVDVDGTPVVVGDTVFVTSSTGGLWALDHATGLVRWSVPLRGSSPSQSIGTTGGLTTDGQRLYVTAADLGIYAFDLDGNLLWRQGARDGGEPATPLVSGDYLIYSLANTGVYVADKRSGNVLEYFNPGDGISGDPTVVGDQELLVMSNRGVLYSLDLRAL